MGVEKTAPRTRRSPRAWPKSASKQIIAGATSPQPMQSTFTLFIFGRFGGADGTVAQEGAKEIPAFDRNLGRYAPYFYYTRWYISRLGFHFPPFHRTHAPLRHNSNEGQATAVGLHVTVQQPKQIDGETSSSCDRSSPSKCARTRSTTKIKTQLFFLIAYQQEKKKKKMFEFGETRGGETVLDDKHDAWRPAQGTRIYQSGEFPYYCARILCFIETGLHHVSSELKVMFSTFFCKDSIFVETSNTTVVGVEQFSSRRGVCAFAQ